MKTDPLNPVAFLVSLFLLLLATTPADAQDAVDFSNLSDEAITHWGQSQHVFQAKLTGVVAGPVAKSLPPIFNYRLSFQVSHVLRGNTPQGKPLTCFYSVRQMTRPTFPEGAQCLVSAEKSRGSLRVLKIEKLGAGNLNDARFATNLPLGWTFRDGKLASPWSSLKGDAWPDNQRGKGFLVCSRTGRPTFLAGKGIRFTVAPVPPRKEIKFTNPDGDGEYKVTVTNPTDKPLEVSALRRSGDKLLWSESLVILCQKKVYPLPTSRGISDPTTAVVLKPGESVSTVVNVLGLAGPEWPRGGYRIAFQFCLGEQSNIQSLYYMSRHHDALRDAARKKLQ